VPLADVPVVGPGQAVLATWHLLLDDGRLQAGEPWLAGTARRPVARLSPATASAIGVAAGELVTVSTDAGSLSLPLVVTDLPDGVVWLPTNQSGHPVRAALRADSGAIVSVRRADLAAAVGAAGHLGSTGGAAVGAAGHLGSTGGATVVQDGAA
jgi:NADH-quinone oxidoreductase subunit G